jgi:hypothetical protein
VQGDVNTFNDSEGVLFAEISALANDLTYRRISLSNSTSSNRLSLIYWNESNKLIFELNSAGVQQVFLQFTLPSEVSFNKIAAKYKYNDFSLWVNGIEVETDLIGSTFAPIH